MKRGALLFLFAGLWSMARAEEGFVPSPFPPSVHPGSGVVGWNEPKSHFEGVWPEPDSWTVSNESRWWVSFYWFRGDFPAGTGAQGVARSGSSRFAAAAGVR